jgi:hypothetical protein
MAHDPQTLTLEAGEWTDEAALWLDQAKGAATLDDLKAQTESGAVLFYVRHEGITVGAFLLRVDQTASGAEGVIVAAAAQLRGVDMIASCMPAIESKFTGCKFVRFHTGQPALARKLARVGYVPAEIVSIKTLGA